MAENTYPLIIIGAGPAGLTASIYASRYKIEHIVIGQAVGGLAFDAHEICNFPTEKEITGKDLSEKMQAHAESLGAVIFPDKVVRIKEENKLFKVITQRGKTFFGKTILLAIGTAYRQLNLPDEDKFLGRGVSYCATCDAMFFQDKVVAVIGGSDSANTASLYLAEIAKKVYQIYRRDKLRGEMAWVEQVMNNKKISVIYNTEVVGLKGNEKLEKVILNKPWQDKKELSVDGLFIEIGTVPQRLLIEQLSLETTDLGYIKVGPDQRTNKEDVWAAGDITTNSNNFRQIVTACAEGAIAAENIFEYLQRES